MGIPSMPVEGDPEKKSSWEGVQTLHIIYHYILTGRVSYFEFCGLQLITGIVYHDVLCMVLLSTLICTCHLLKPFQLCIFVKLR